MFLFFFWVHTCVLWSTEADVYHKARPQRGDDLLSVSCWLIELPVFSLSASSAPPAKPKTVFLLNIQNIMYVRKATKHLVTFEPKQIN